MDTSSPWGEEEGTSAVPAAAADGAGWADFATATTNQGPDGGEEEAGWADFSTASQEESHGGDGWADFGASSAGGDEAAAAAAFEADFGSLNATAAAADGSVGSRDSGSQGNI
jgi:hypothetical protein